MARKWIGYEKDGQLYLALGNFDYHRDALPKDKNGFKVLGGGEWYMSEDRSELVLYASSVEFGQISLEDLQKIREDGLYSFGLKDIKWKFSTHGSLPVAIFEGEYL